MFLELSGSSAVPTPTEEKHCRWTTGRRVGSLRLVDVKLEFHIADGLVDVRGRPGDRGSLAHLGPRILPAVLGVSQRIPDDQSQQERDGGT